MNAVYARTGTYTDSWQALGSARRLPGGPDRPRGKTLAFDGKYDGWEVFQHYTYVIEHASETDYLIRAIDSHGRATWQMRAAVLKPEQLAPDFCRDEAYARRDPSEEAQRFLIRARRWIRVHATSRGSLPMTWPELHMHYSLEDHLKGDTATKPPPGIGNRWKPAGSRYTYVLENGDCTLRVVSENALGLPNYVVEGATQPVRPVGLADMKDER